jgi:hypothetical protein
MIYPQINAISVDSEATLASSTFSLFYFFKGYSEALCPFFWQTKQEKGEPLTKFELEVLFLSSPSLYSPPPLRFFQH